MSKIVRHTSGRLRRKRGETSRAKIVAASQRLFHERGFANSSLQDIANAAGVLKGNLTYYFGTKEAVLDEVSRTEQCNLAETFQRFEKQGDTPQARILLFIGMIEKNASQLKEFGCPIGSLNTELGKANAELLHYAQMSMRMCIDWLGARFLEMGQHQKEAMASAEHIMCATQGAAVLAQALQNTMVVKRQCAQLRIWVARLND